VDLKCRDVIYEWLEHSHVKEFWDNSQDFKDDLLIFINGRKSHSSYFNGIFTYWIGKTNGEPYCLVMTSEVVLNESLPQVWKDNISGSGKTYTIDFCIGNKNYLGKGLASLTLETFTKFFQKDIYCNADTFFIDPNENNPRAKHVYEKAGFEIVDTFDMGIGFFKGHKFLLMVKKLSN
jgi:RimJ/RimL family protein N-acetyltransferase